MKSKFFGINAKIALAVLAVCGLFTSCYEKEEVDVTPTPTLPDPVYVICGNVTDAATGKPISTPVTVGTQTVNTNDGYYEVTSNLEGGKSYKISVSVNGYNDAVKTIYLPVVQNGQTSVGTVDFELSSTASGSDVVAPGANSAATVSEAEEALEAVKESAIELLNGFGEVNAEEMVAEVDAAGNTILTVPAEVTATTGESVVVSVPTFTGFASTITPETDNIFTRALTDGQVWIASAEQTLNLTYGLKATTSIVTLPGVIGKQISGYVLKVTMANRTLDINDVTGTVTYQVSYVTTPKYDSHDSHDSHDGHGSNPGAGGGSSANN